MFKHLSLNDLDSRRAEIKNNIEDAYNTHVRHKVRKVEQKNILLIGRTRTGKSTIKRVLVNPTVVTEEMTLASQTKEATFESFVIDDNHTVLNIIDTPGLFERGTDVQKVQDNAAILKTIERCIEREITKFHLVAFCASFESGINEDDVKSIKALIDFLGPDVSKNSCLVVTRCESKNTEQLQNLKNEIKSDIHFKPLAGYFKQGVFFFGALDRDSWNNATDNLYRQFENIVQYRELLIKLLGENTTPFAVKDSNVSDFRKLVEEQKQLQKQIADLKAKGIRDETLIANYERKLGMRACGIS
ncbi:unnamed protein product [Adineta steineri]|uniref:AIG1-type G domain-containing protein n=1 Tax=Adineta steineri TaxID=433720 RepID=A0A815PD25_9BILA|nr:unnamed protein product [Adineta steineri]CAF1447533.1 unnamed protein product [Adineta steineri]CAF1517318.1 unnamed protein product [Adineta steineri]CAF1517348.1 unnamed protein product [Adineta steineri]CAF1649072.1 unnamed protein product [Adineta steineri]